MIKKIVTKVLKNSKYNLWKNSLDTINCFKNIKNKNRTMFIRFDIINFYPSLLKELLIDIINFAKKYTNITEDEVDIILACRRSVLINNNNMWVKNHMDNFDVTMGSFDSVQSADLVTVYIYIYIYIYISLFGLYIYI